MKQTILFSVISLMLLVMNNSCKSSERTIQNDKINQQQLVSAIYTQVMDSLRQEMTQSETGDAWGSHIQFKNDTLTINNAEMIQFVVGENKIIIDQKGVTIKSSTTTIDAEEKLALTSERDLSLNSKTDIEINALNIGISANVALVLEGRATTQLRASGQLQLDGAIIMIGGGAKPVARMGDPVIVDGKQGQIIQGSPTVLVGN